MAVNDCGSDWQWFSGNYVIVLCECDVGFIHQADNNFWFKEPNLQIP
jgi:hypothetical protein